eukprot:1167115-Pleurochrysis_carterae.AAC.1
MPGSDGEKVRLQLVLMRSAALTITPRVRHACCTLLRIVASAVSQQQHGPCTLWQGAVWQLEPELPALYCVAIISSSLMLDNVPLGRVRYMRCSTVTEAWTNYQQGRGEVKCSSLLWRLHLLWLAALPSFPEFET